MRSHDFRTEIRPHDQQTRNTIGLPVWQLNIVDMNLDYLISSLCSLWCRIHSSVILTPGAVHSVPLILLLVICDVQPFLVRTSCVAHLLETVEREILQPLILPTRISGDTFCVQQVTLLFDVLDSSIIHLVL